MLPGNNLQITSLKLRKDATEIKGLKRNRNYNYSFFLSLYLLTGHSFTFLDYKACIPGGWFLIYILWVIFLGVAILDVFCFIYWLGKISFKSLDLPLILPVGLYVYISRKIKIVRKITTGTLMAIQVLFKQSSFGSCNYNWRLRQFKWPLRS